MSAAAVRTTPRRRAYRSFRSKHRPGNSRHRPPADPEQYNPCAEYYVTASDCSHLPRQLDGRKTPRTFWDVLVAIADMSQDGRPCYMGLRSLARRCGHHPETVVKYRQLAQELGMVRQLDRPGGGGGRKTSLSVPVRSPYWASFRRRAESEFRSNSLTPLGLYEIKSEDVSRIEASSPVPNDAPPIAPPPPSCPTDNTALQEQSDAPQEQRWTISMVLAAVLTVLGWRLHSREGMSIIRTCRQRKLTQHTPEAVMHAVLALGKEEYGQLAAEKIVSPGAFVHAKCKRVTAANVPEVPKILEFTSSTTGYLTQSIPPPRRATGGDPPGGDDSPAYAELRRRYEQLPPPPPPKPRGIDRDRADELLRERGLDPDAVIAWVWDHPPRPTWPVTPDELEELAARYEGATRKPS